MKKCYLLFILLFMLISLTADEAKFKSLIGWCKENVATIEYLSTWKDKDSKESKRGVAECKKEIYARWGVYYNSIKGAKTAGITDSDKTVNAIFKDLEWWDNYIKTEGADITEIQREYGFLSYQEAVYQKTIILLKQLKQAEADKKVLK